MNKLLLQISAIILLFFLTWFALSKIDWVSIFNIEKNTSSTEEKLGDLFWDLIQKSQKEIHSKQVISTIDSLVQKICDSNDIDKSKVKVHIMESSEVNAFALPNKHLILYTGLISASANEAELCGVICHELAHMEKNHVMKKLIKEVGLSVLISMTAGKGGSDIIRSAAKHLSSSAYDRNLEKEADITAVDYMVKAHIDPEAFANFLYQFVDSESREGHPLTWISTHPDSRERAEYIIEYSKGKSKKTEEIVSHASWDKMKEKLSDL